MDSKFQDSISNLLGEKITAAKPVSGGDISAAFLLHTTANKFFCKIHSGAAALSMFETEKRGLEAIASTNTLKTPEVYVCSEIGSSACLIMEYIEADGADDKSMFRLGEGLAALHLCKTDNFGFDHNNFIGSLPQSNNKHSSWTDFYINERLLPQFEMARSALLLTDGEIPSNEHMQTVLTPLFEGVEASLLHGDLWGGNYLIDAAGEPYLIDPAVYHGHSEVDIAMSKLFGGFSPGFYSAYESIIPAEKHTGDRISIYQLYYLLVHLNLFGSSYKSSVNTILKSYFY